MSAEDNPQGGEHLGEAPIGEHDGQQAEPGTGDNPDVGGITTGPGSHGETPEGARFGADAGGHAHTGEDEGHPAGDGPRSDRDVGGPTSESDAEPGEGSATGDIQTKGFDSHS